jgi:hypothetical protein
VVAFRSAVISAKLGARQSASFIDGAATMDSTTQSASPLRQRMLEDMRMRRLETRTQEAYIRAVRKLAA